MPLHLLGKKSWNVYNADNIARVRRDEAAAKVAEEAEELRMQEVDAQRRLAILRGELPPPIIDEESGKPERHKTESGRPKRKRKREGEDDTDFELRLAKEWSDPASKTLVQTPKSSSSAPIVDHRGHIDLFGDERSRAYAEKNEEAEKEARKKRQEYEDQYTMRLSQAAGRDGMKNPWYSQGDVARGAEPMKDVWGKDDPRRKQRDTDRIAANDPLTMMKKGASRVRELEKERNKIQEEREEDLRQMRKEDRRRERQRRRDDCESRSHRSASPDSNRRHQQSRESRYERYERHRDRGCDRRRYEHRRHSDRHLSRSRSRGHERRRHREDA